MKKMKLIFSFPLLVCIFSLVAVGCHSQRENICLDGSQAKAPVATSSFDGDSLAVMKERLGSLPPEEFSRLLEEYNLKGEFVPKELIIRFRADATSSEIDEVFKRISGVPVFQFQSNDAYHVKVPLALEKIDLVAFAKGLSLLDGVEYVHANGIKILVQTPNDTHFSQLYGLKNSGQTGGTAGSDIRADVAWDVTTGSKDVRIGIIDTGVDPTHPDLKGNLWVNPGEFGSAFDGRDKRSNGIDDDQNGYVDDYQGWNFASNNNRPYDDHGHGTHVSGTIGAIGNNGQGVTGVNWTVSLVPLKVFNASGRATDSDIIKAIEYSNMMNIPITSNSYGSSSANKTERAAIEGAQKRGALFVAAAGNNGSNSDSSPQFPASYSLPNIVAVAATNHRDELASFSNFGLRSVHLGAPGVDILSTFPGAGYRSLSGTSMATPHVSGVAGLIKSIFPNDDFAAMKLKLLANVDPITSLNGKSISGGRLNASKSLEVEIVAPSTPVSIYIEEVGMTILRLSFPPSGDDGKLGRAYSYQIRKADSPILTLEDWDKAKTPSFNIGENESSIVANITELEVGSAGFLTIRAVDNVNNLSGLSESVNFKLYAAKLLTENKAESMDGIKADGSWGIESDQERGNVFSDSPSGNYRNSVNTRIELAPVKMIEPDLLLEFFTKLDLEPGYDFGILELSTNASPEWREIKRYSASACAWAKEQIELSPFLNGASEVKVRFRLISDSMENDSGWLIDDVKFYSKMLVDDFKLVELGYSGADFQWVAQQGLSTKLEYCVEYTTPSCYIVNIPASPSPAQSYRLTGLDEQTPHRVRLMVEHTLSGAALTTEWLSFNTPPRVISIGDLSPDISGEIVKPYGKNIRLRGISINYAKCTVINCPRSVKIEAFSALKSDGTSIIQVGSLQISRGRGRIEFKINPGSRVQEIRMKASPPQVTLSVTGNVAP